MNIDPLQCESQRSKTNPFYQSTFWNLFHIKTELITSQFIEEVEASDFKMSRPFNDFMLITNETDKSEVEKIWQSYLSGEPFFTKEKLEEIDKILTEIHDNS